MSNCEALKIGDTIRSFERPRAGDDNARVLDTKRMGIKEEGIPAVFAKPQFAAEILREAAKGTGVRAGTIRSLADDAAPTYVQMMGSNAERAWLTISGSKPPDIKTWVVGWDLSQL